MKCAIPDQEPERQDEGPCAITRGNTEHKPSPGSAGGEPQNGEQREEEQPEGDKHRLGGGIGKVKRAGQSSEGTENQENAEHSLEDAVDTKQEARSAKRSGLFDDAGCLQLLWFRPCELR